MKSRANRDFFLMLRLEKAPKKRLDLNLFFGL